MRMTHLLLAGLAATALTGCPQQRQAPEVSEASPQGAPVAEAPVSEPDTVAVGNDATRAREYLGNAFVAAARTHSAVISGEYRAARNALNDMRRQMRLANQFATIDQQRVINRLDAEAIDLAAALDTQSPAAAQDSNQLVKSFFGYYDQLVASSGGGAGTGLTSPEPLREQGAPPAVLPSPSPYGAPSTMPQGGEGLNDDSF